MKITNSIYIVHVNGIAVQFVSNHCGRFILDGKLDSEAQRFPSEAAAHQMATAYGFRAGGYEVCEYEPK